MHKIGAVLEPAILKRPTGGHGTTLRQRPREPRRRTGRKPTVKSPTNQLPMCQTHMFGSLELAHRVLRRLQQASSLTVSREQQGTSLHGAKPRSLAESPSCRDNRAHGFLGDSTTAAFRTQIKQPGSPFPALMKHTPCAPPARRPGRPSSLHHHRGSYLKPQSGKPTLIGGRKKNRFFMAIWRPLQK